MKKMIFSTFMLCGKQLPYLSRQSYEFINASKDTILSVSRAPVDFKFELKLQQQGSRGVLEIEPCVICVRHEYYLLKSCIGKRCQNSRFKVKMMNRLHCNGAF